MVDFNNPKFKKFCRERRIKRLEIFGSFAKNSATPTSDLDLIVEFHAPVGLIALIEAQMALEELFGLKVDLITKNEISPYLRDEIMASKKVVYEEAG